MGFPATILPGESVLAPPAPVTTPRQGPGVADPHRDFQRILYLVGEDTYGGLEDYIRELARTVQARGSEVSVWFAARPGESPELPGRLRRSGLDVHVIRFDSHLLRGVGRNLRSLIRLGRWIRQREIDLIHIHLSPFHVYFLSVLLARLLLVPRVVLNLVGIEPDRQRRERLADPLVARMVDRIVVISRALRDQARAVGFQSSGFSVIYMGEDLERFQNRVAMGQRLRSELRLPPRALVVGMVARLHPLKGQETLLKAARRVLLQFPGVHFLVVGGGDPSYRHRLEEEVHRLGISDRVHFLGHRRDIPEVTEAMDVAVLPSENEAMGHCLLEAMALGKPVVASRIGGIPEVVVDGRTGYLVPPGDDRILADSLLRLLREPRERKAFGEAARRRIAGRFGLDDWVRRTLAFYRDLAGGCPRAIYEE